MSGPCMGDPGKKAGVAMLKALGLPVERCATLDVAFRPNSLVEVKVCYHPTEEQAELLAQTLRGYLVALFP